MPTTRSGRATGPGDKTDTASSQQVEQPTAAAKAPAVAAVSGPPRKRATAARAKSTSGTDADAPAEAHPPTKDLGVGTQAQSLSQSSPSKQKHHLTAVSGSSSPVQNGSGSRYIHLKDSPSSPTKSVVRDPESHFADQLAADGLHLASGGDGGSKRQQSGHHTQHPTAWDERGSLGLLVLLYMIQGIPLGLTLGAM